MRRILPVIFFGILISAPGRIFALTYLEIPSITVKGVKPAFKSFNLEKITITAQEIKESGATTISQLLDGYAGIQVYDLTGDNSQPAISMRGFGDNASSNSLVLVDGLPLRNPDLSAPQLNNIELGEIERIDVIPGSRGTQFGDQAVGGVINIISKKSKHHSGNVALELGSFQQRNLRASLSNVFQNGFDFRLNANRDHTDNYRRHNNFDQTNLSGRVGYRYQTGALRLRYQTANTQQLLAGGLSAEQVSNDRRHALNQRDFSDQKNSLTSLNWQQKIFSQWRLKTDFFQDKTTGNGIVSFPFSQSRTLYYFAPRLIGQLHDSQLTTGIDLQNDRYELQVTGFSNHDAQQTYSGFVRYIFPLFKKLQITLGSRIAQQHYDLASQNTTRNTDANAFVTEIGVTYRLKEDLEFLLRRDGSYRFPKADENSNTSPGVIGLQTQTGASYEAGINFTTFHFKNRVLIYTLRLQDEIAFDPESTPTDPFGTNSNLDPTRRNGLILSTGYDLTKKFSINGQYSFVDARFSEGKNAGNRVPFVAQDTLRISGNYHFATHWNLFLEGLYTGNRFPAGDDKNQSILIGGYTMYNFNVSYKIKSLTTSFRVNNIFNKKYNAYTVFNPVAKTNAFYPAPERSFMLTVEYAVS